jgi:hypothetical protein
VDRAPTSITPITELRWTRRRAELGAWEDSVTEALWRRRQEPEERGIAAEDHPRLQDAGKCQ